MRRGDLTDAPFAPLTIHLLDLLHALEGKDIPLILVGGYSIFLRQLMIAQAGVDTILKYDPPARGTEDFDLVLKLEIIADLSRMQALRTAFDGLGYKVVTGAENYQFFKPETAWENHRDVKIDLLARRPEPGDPQLPCDEFLSILAEVFPHA